MNKRFSNNNNNNNHRNKVENYNEPQFNQYHQPQSPLQQQQHQHNNKMYKNYSSKNQRFYNKTFYHKISEESNFEEVKRDEQMATVPSYDLKLNEPMINENELVVNEGNESELHQCIPQEQCNVNVNNEAQSTNNMCNNVYEYDYAPQYYVYHPYTPEYSNVQLQNVQTGGSPVSASSNGLNTTANSTTTSTTQQYYAYQPIPSYIYDPNLAYTAHYSPNPQIQPILSSPQHQSTILASYHTPPQAQHQLYLTPASLSPNDQSSSANNERPSTCNSPQVSAMPQQITQTPVTTNPLSPASSYLYYPNHTNPYLTPQQQTFHSPTYMMYQTPTVYQTMPPTNPATPVINPNTNLNYNSKYSKSKKFSSKKKLNNFEQSPQVSSLTYTPVEQQLPCYNEGVNCEGENFMIEQQQQQQQGVYPMYPTLPYGDPMVPFPPCGYDFENEYESYGDEYVDDEYNGNPNNNRGDQDDDEQLACKICRGRRMCFCYFLKVRYYKFPSFFDLVDHQYKKWRSSMVKVKKA